MIYDTPYETKNLRNQLCEFILKKRVEQPNIGVTIRIPLRELKSLLEYSSAVNIDEKIENLVNELQTLHDERFGPNSKKKVIEITDTTVLNNFKTKLDQGGFVLQIKCLSDDIKEYQRELENKTEEALRYLGLSKLKHMDNGGVAIILGDKKMKVGISKQGNTNLQANLIKIMYNGPAVFIGSTEKPGDEKYSRGDFVSLKDIVEIIRKIKGDDDGVGERITSRVELKSIKDAVINLNKKSLEIFTSPLFEITDQEIRWVL